jgi:glycosyltransferase involved in cell wall biosynthesis
MKVLHISSEKSWRGGEQQIAYLITELQKLGVQSAAAVKKGSAFEKWCAGNNIPFISLDFANDFDFRSAIGLKKYCAAERFDLVHLHSSRGHGIAFLASLLGNKTPLVLSRKVDFELKQNFFSKWKYNHSRIKKIICVSDKVREIVGRTISHPEKCVTVYDGIDLERFAGKGRRGVIRKELGIGNDEILIGNIAAIAPHKDYFTFLDTVTILNGKIKAKYFISGEGPLQKDIENRIAVMNLDKDVFMLGFRNDLENVFAELSILLYTSNEEGLGSTLLGAMAYGLPIVTTEAGGISEIVKNGFNGLTAPVRNPQKLSEQVMLLLNDPSLRETLIANGKKFVREFSKEKMAERTLEVYKQMVSANE